MQADSKEPAVTTWRDLYLSALFEVELAKLPERIAAAEYALGLRDRELWYSAGEHTQEKQALAGATRALEALRNIHQCPRPVPRTHGHVANAGSDVLWRNG
jgi:hypothetical protein